MEPGYCSESNLPPPNKTSAMEAVCRPGRCRSLSYPLSYCLLVLVLLSSVDPSVQVLEFREAPLPWYYTLTSTATLISCHIVETVDDMHTTLNPTFFRNSIPFTHQSSPPRHLLEVDGGENVVGLLIVPTELGDSGTVYHCSVETAGGQVLRSRNSTLLVGDGRPLTPEEPPYQVSETLHSIRVEWGASRTPDHAPILGYTLTYWPQHASRDQAVAIDTPDNETALELRELVPGRSYNVVVSGRNRYGLGTPSSPVVVLTMSSELPPAPGNVVGTTRRTDFGTVIDITWMLAIVDLDIALPVESYLVVIQSSSGRDEVVGMVQNTTMSYTFTITAAGSFLVGVASNNSVGQSDVVFDERNITIDGIALPTATPAPTTPAPTTPAPTTTVSTAAETGATAQEPDTTSTQIFQASQSATNNNASSLSGNRVITIAAVVAAASIFLVILSVLIFLVIFYLRVKTKHMDTLSFSSSSDSPPSRKKTERDIVTHRTKKKDALSTELQEIPNGKQEEFLNENRCRSLPVLGDTEMQRQSFQFQSMDLSELGTKV